jgi:hypothetical protein
MIIKKFFQIIIFFFILTNNLYACFSFLPYAFNGKFAYLPKNMEICFNKNDGEIVFTTNMDGARVIESNEIDDDSMPLYIFGDSQILGIDWSDDNKKLKHDIAMEFPDRSMIIFAAPNNGPFQTLERLKNLFKNSSNEVKEVIIGFNYGTDIFRVNKNWKAENFIPLDEDSLESVLKSPFVYDLIIIKGMLEGKYFTMTNDIAESNLNQFLSVSDDELKKSVDSWLIQLESILDKNEIEINFLIYPPYWGFEDNGRALKADVMNKYLYLVCNEKLNDIFDNTFLSFPREKLILSGDGRHFATGSLEYFNMDEVDINWCG